MQQYNLSQQYHKICRLKVRNNKYNTLLQILECKLEQQQQIMGCTNEQLKNEDLFYTFCCNLQNDEQKLHFIESFKKYLQILKWKNILLHRQNNLLQKMVQYSNRYIQCMIIFKSQLLT